jgi:hypothetical protein
MVHPLLLSTLYLSNTLWFILAFLQFSFRPHVAMTAGSLRLHSKDPRIKATPSGDAWHHDLLVYLGGLNAAPAALAALRLTVLVAPGAWGLSAFSTGSLAGDRPLNVLALAVLGLANFSQARVNFGVVRGTGRWVVGEFDDAITLVDGLLPALDWGTAIAIGRGA